MADSGTLLFILAIVLTFLLPRVAAAIGLASSLLCVPLCCFFIAPLLFAHVFARGMEFSSKPAPGFTTIASMALFTVILEFGGGTYISQFQASSPDDAAVKHADY